jgi:hypothetical protein
MLPTLMMLKRKTAWCQKNFGGNFNGPVGISTVVKRVSVPVGDEDI